MDPQYVPEFEAILWQTFEEMEGNTNALITNNTREIGKIQHLIDKLECRFIEDGLEIEVYQKHLKKYKNQIALLERGKHEAVKLSNPQEFVDFSMRMVTKIDRIWQKSPISEKRIIQQLAFPMGLQYNKLESTCRTPKINTIFKLTHSISANYTKGNKKTGGLVRFSTKGGNLVIF